MLKTREKGKMQKVIGMKCQKIYKQSNGCGCHGNKIAFSVEPHMGSLALPPDSGGSPSMCYLACAPGNQSL